MIKRSCAGHSKNRYAPLPFKKLYEYKQKKKGEKPTMAMKINKQTTNATATGNVCKQCREK